MFWLPLFLLSAAPVTESALEEVHAGFQFTEGPVWHPDGFLLFSDIPANRIYRWSPEEGISVFREPSGHSNGLTYDRQGRLIACEHGNRRVSRTERDGTITPLATHYQGKRLNSPNDVVVKSDGAIYFTDPPYGVEESERELDFQGVYRIDPEGSLTLLVDDFEKPNGLAFSPDEKRLYIADTPRLHVRVFDVQEDGTLTGGSVFCEQVSDEPGGPDGMKVDTEGHLYVTAAKGVWVYDSTGKYLGIIETPARPANCAFGGPDNRTLYITARTAVYQIRLKVPGIPALR